MIRCIIFLFLTVFVAYGATNFTDVTIAGTPYLTTNVMYEIYDSYIEKINTGYIENQTNVSYSTGAIANRIPDGLADRGLGTLVRFVRDYVHSHYPTFTNNPLGWVAEIPTNSFDKGDIIYSSDEEFLLALGLTNGWRKATSYDPATNDWRDLDDTMYGTGTNTSIDIVAGEILGPWIIDDLQKALGGLKYWVSFDNVVYADLSWVTNGLSVNYAYSDGDSTNSWAEAKSNAETGFTPSLERAGLPSKYTRGYRFAFGITIEYGWRARARSQSAKLLISNIYRGSNNTVNVLGGTIRTAVYGDEPSVVRDRPFTFDSNGDDIENNKWTIFDSISVTAGNTNNFMSSTFGDTSLPNWCSEPAITNTSPDDIVYQGYEVEGAWGELIIVEPSFSYYRE